MSREWTLTEAARSLGEPQHRLIYLCEKGVVHPDLEDAKGRGSSRRFSTRNLLEFAIALRLRELEIPAAFIGAITYTLRVFEKKVQTHLPDFSLPDSLRGAGAPDVRVILANGRLYVTLSRGKEPARVYGGIDLRRLGRRRPSVAQLQHALTPLPARHRANGDGSLIGNGQARVEISVTRIAQELRLEA